MYLHVRMVNSTNQRPRNGTPDTELTNETAPGYYHLTSVFLMRFRTLLTYASNPGSRDILSTNRRTAKPQTANQQTATRSLSQLESSNRHSY